MAFFLSKEYREQRAKAKESERLEEKRENSRYSDWYSRQIQNLRDDDLIDKLGKLAILKERGVITDEEFTKLKSKLMSRI